MTDAADPTPPPQEPSMEIHKPKPIHNWRDFVKEVGTIVLGVCIALAAEQAVEWWHWRAQVAEAREVIATELTSNLVGAMTRVQTRNCTERRLDALSLILDEAAKKRALPPIGDAGVTPRSVWPTGAWESVVASQTATHFPRQLLADMAAAYKFVQRLEQFSGQEVQSWKALYPMIGPGRRLDPASEAALRQALSSARIDNRIMASLSSQMIDAVVSLHLRLGPEDRDRLIARQKQPLNAWSICKPMGAVAGSYGQSYGANTPESRLEGSLKNLRDHLQARDE